jgi:hypothetical protein
MKFIEGIVSAVQGNAKEKLNDPLIGSFIASFIVCNWQHVLVFIFGNAKIEERITAFVTAMKPVGDDWLGDLFGIYLLPLLMALAYVVLMPWISIGIAKLTKPAAIGKYEAAVDLEINLAIKQRKLNEEKLLNDPSKDFLTRVVENRLKEEIILTERKIHQTSMLEDEAKKVTEELAKAKADRETAEATSNKAKNEDDLQKTKNEYEKNKLSVGVAITNSMLQANSYYSSLNFVRLLSESLAEDNIAITHKSLTEIIAAAFGYENYDDLLKDQTFHNEGLRGLKYILLDSVSLGARLEKILGEDFIDEDICSADHIFDHLTSIFDSLPYLFGDEETIADAIFEKLEIDKYELIHEDVVGSALAEANTGDVDIELTDKDWGLEEGSLKVTITGYGSGTHHKESDIAGQGIDISVEVTVPVLWGKYGLGRSSMIISASPRLYDDDWEVA